MRAQAHDIRLDLEELEVVPIEVDHAHELLLELLLRTVDVGIIHLHGAHAHQAKELAALFIAIAGAIFGQPHRQIAIAAQLAVIDLVVHGDSSWA